MPDLEIIILALSLSLDSFAVSLALSAAGHLKSSRSRFRISFHFGLFQFLMPVAGWAIGTHIEPYIRTYDHFIAAGLLTLVALRMIRSALDDVTRNSSSDPSRGWILITLSTATSIDALAVGLGLAALRISVWYPSIIIGLITMVLSFLAIISGKQVGSRLGKQAQIVGGIVLLLIAVKIVLFHST